MPLDWKNYSGLVPAGCLPCCAGGGPPPPTECACALLIPFDPSNITPSTPYSDYATAASAIADYVYDCILYANGNPSSVTVDTSIADEITALVSTSTGVGAQEDFICLNLYSGESLTIDYDLTTSETDGDFFAAIYDCTGTQISFDRVTDGPLTGTLDLGTVPADGIYKVYVTTNEFIGTSSFELVFNSTGIFANPVIALWDDSGTTRQLEACPKLYLPILTESTGDWMSDCSNSQNLITTQVIDCLAYSEVTPLITSSASGTAPFVVAQTLNSSAFIPWASFNGVVGDVWTFAFTRSAGPVFVYMAVIHDYTGTVVETLSSGSSPLVSSSLPYTGRYIVRMFMVGSGGTGIDSTVSVSSSGTLEVNPVQVLYDVGLDCPARLSCGDSCP